MNHKINHFIGITVATVFLLAGYSFRSTNTEKRVFPKNHRIYCSLWQMIWVMASYSGKLKKRRFVQYNNAPFKKDLIKLCCYWTLWITSNRGSTKVINFWIINSVLCLRIISSLIFSICLKTVFPIWEQRIFIKSNYYPFLLIVWEFYILALQFNSHVERCTVQILEFLLPVDKLSVRFN